MSGAFQTNFTFKLLFYQKEYMVLGKIKVWFKCVFHSIINNLANLSECKVERTNNIFMFLAPTRLNSLLYTIPNCDN